MTITERQEIKNRIAGAEHLAADSALFARMYARHPLHRELSRANRVNSLALDRQVVYLLLAKVSERDILASRAAAGAGHGSPDGGNTAAPAGENQTVPAEASAEAFAEEAPVKKKAASRKSSRK